MPTQPIVVDMQALYQRIEKKAKEVVEAAKSLQENRLEVDGLVDPAKVFLNRRFRSTAVSLGKDVRVGTKAVVGTPTINYVEIKLDGQKNPYIEVNFSIDRQTVDSGRLKSFRLYRKRTPVQNVAQRVEAFNQADFDLVAKGTKRSGKFSEDKKATYNVARDLIPPQVQNQNMYELQQQTWSQQLGQVNPSNQALDLPDFFQAPTSAAAARFEKIAEIDYTAFEAKLAKRQVFVKDRNTVTLTFRDNKVAYGEAFEYTVSSFATNAEESAKAASVSVQILNLTGIERPVTFSVRQVKDHQIDLAAILAPEDNIKNIFLFKRETDEVRFRSLGAFQNNGDTFRYSDADVAYLRTYTYRIILQNVFGVLSEPQEVTITSSSQRVINKTRSNNLNIPIVIAVQDQVSDGIKINIFPNDPRILYYELTRKDMTIGERDYTVPGNKKSDKPFWEQNQFMVQENLNRTASLIAASQRVDDLANNTIPPQSEFVKFAKQLTFVDRFVTSGHVYQYRVCGIDVFGNRSSYAFSTLGAHGKNSVRAPVNLKIETIRETPFRIKLAWANDNESQFNADAYDAAKNLLQITLQTAALNSEQVNYLGDLILRDDLEKIDLDRELRRFNLRKEQVDVLQKQREDLDRLRNSLSFRIQRRRVGDIAYDTFPLTRNNFIIDEVGAADAIKFAAEPSQDTYVKQASVQPPSDAEVFTRPFGFPSYLKNYETYEYRVSAVSLDGKESDYSESVQVLVLAEMSPPIDFQAVCLNSRVRPVTVQLSWGVDPLKSRPDHWLIERKSDVPTDVFRVIGTAYLDSEYFDRSVQTGNQYVYRVRSISAIGSESTTAEARIVI